VNLTVLKRNQYCVVLDAVDTDGRNCLGAKELRVGPKTFFLQPGNVRGCGWVGCHISAIAKHCYGRQ
jgi:hypothetical protein